MAQCIRRYCNLLRNVPSAVTLDGVTYAQLNMIFEGIPCWWLRISTKKCWSKFYVGIYEVPLQ